MEEMRKAVGRFGITGKTQTQPMAQLSDGLRSRVVFAWLVRKSNTCLQTDNSWVVAGESLIATSQTAAWPDA